MKAFRKCCGSGAATNPAKILFVASYESVDGKSHSFINCPVCGKQLASTSSGLTIRTHSWFPSSSQADQQAARRQGVPR